MELLLFIFKKGEEKIENFRVEKSEPLEKVCGKIYIREVYKSEAVEEKHYEKIMFGNSLMLLGIAIMILAGLELIYIGIMWASFLLIPVGFIMAVIGFLAKTVKFKFAEISF